MSRLEVGVHGAAAANASSNAAGYGCAMCCELALIKGRKHFRFDALTGSLYELVPCFSRTKRTVADAIEPDTKRREVC